MILNENNLHLSGNIYDIYMKQYFMLTCQHFFNTILIYHLESSFCGNPTLNIEIKFVLHLENDF